MTLPVLLERGPHRNFNPAAKRQLRTRIVNRNGAIKLFGRQIYLSRDLAYAQVVVKLSDRVATIYHGETVLQKVVGQEAQH